MYNPGYRTHDNQLPKEPIVRCKNCGAWLENYRGDWEHMQGNVGGSGCCCPEPRQK